MTDLVVFAGIVGLVAIVGIVVGMIIAGRLDAILATRPRNADRDAPAPDADHDRPEPPAAPAGPAVTEPEEDAT